jgi:hypothetical protein
LSTFSAPPAYCLDLGPVAAVQHVVDAAAEASARLGNLDLHLAVVDDLADRAMIPPAATTRSPRLTRQYCAYGLHLLLLRARIGMYMMKTTGMMEA